MYKKQYDAGRYFLHEHPELSKAWDMPEVKELENLPGVYRVRSTMCCWKMVLKGREQKDTCESLQFGLQIQRSLLKF